MLILHPSSRCDVCLDAYTWQTIAQTPHAIPCGHIFCRPCLFALSPLICPLCRKRFDPSKAKKLHVDRPDTVDENRENDLLQRLAISAEAAEDQLQELLNEVDAWLDSRADDTCLVLRQARATLARYIELKRSGPTLEGALADIQARYKDMTLAHAKLEGDKGALIRANEDLEAEVRELRSQYSHGKNPLPPPPQPVSTEYVPSFAQAIGGHDRVRFEVPSLSIGSPYAQSFEVESRKRHKGKAKSVGHRLISPPSQNLHPLPTQQAKMDPAEENPALISHFDHHNPPSRQRPPTPAPPTGLKLHFENTNQPLDAFELTRTYLREYAQGVVDGQLMVGKTASSRSSTSQQPRASTSRSYSDFALHDSSESIDVRSIRSARSAQVGGTHHISGPLTADTYSRPTHQRQNTASSIDTPVESSSTRPDSQTRSRSRSVPRSNQISHPDLAEILSNNVSSVPPPPRRPVTSLPTSPPNPNPNPNSQSSHGPQQLESSVQSNLTRPISPAPSMVSKASTWGTFVSTSTNLTTYSLLGLRDFRESSYPRTADSPVLSLNNNNNTTSPRVRGRNGHQMDPRRSSQYSLTSWHGSAASSSPVQLQDPFSSLKGYYHYEGENENAMRRDDELLNPSYSRDSTGRRPRQMEPQGMTRGRRNQPLPALSPSPFSHDSSEAAIIINEVDDRSDSTTFMSFGNALGLELSTGPPGISAPTPVVPHRTFLRSFSDT